MMYLIEPDATVLMTSHDLGAIKVMQKRDRRDPATLAWTPAPSGIQPADVLTAALRHGIDIRRGLMVHPAFVETLMEPGRLRRIAEEQRRVEDQLASLGPAPGQSDEERQQLKKARQDAGDAIHEAEVAADKLKNEDVKDELVSAWDRMGGTMAGSHAA